MDQNHMSELEPESQRIASAMERLRQAMVDVDQPVLESLTSPDLNYGHSGGAVENQAQFVRTLVSGENQFKRIELTDQTITVLGDIGIMRNRFTAEVIAEGTVIHPCLGVLLIWQRQGNEWKLLARQACKI